MVEKEDKLAKKFVDVKGDKEQLKKGFLKYSKNMQECIRFENFASYINSNKNERLRYLLPLDYWLSVIIYPSPAVKIAAENDSDVRCLLKKTREELPRGFLLRPSDSCIKVGEKYMMPIEIDLDTMSHF